MSKIQKFFDITKVDEEARMVYGYASTEALDSQGEIIKLSAMQGAFDDYMKFANIREMHQPSAVGVAKDDHSYVDEKGIYIGAKVVDESAWQKVKEGVYKGFSIGGRVTKRDKVNKTEILGLTLTEISLVDRPANPEATFDVFKADGIEEGDEDAAVEKEDKSDATAEIEIAKAEDAPAAEVPQADIDALAAILDKGDISPARLVELANADMTSKGMYTISRMSELLQAVDYLAQDSKWEAEWEEDGSTVPEQLRAWLVQGVAIFHNVVAEETAELVAQGADSADDGGIVELADASADIEKAGARNSKADQEKIQTMHDHSVSLGASCGAEKAAAPDDLKKFQDDLAKAEDTIAKQAVRITELEAMPTVGKALLHAVAVSKDQDSEATTTVAKAEQAAKEAVVLKEDGTIDQDKTSLNLIKMAQQAPVIRF